MINQIKVTLPSFPKGFHLITSQILKKLPSLPNTGLLHIFVQHTSCGLAINENADPSVRRDLDQAFDKLAPESHAYEHNSEGPDDMPAHIKSVITSTSVSVPITEGNLNLGTWQGIYLCEFRENASPRSFIVTIVS